MTGRGTLVLNPGNRLEYLRYALTGKPWLSARELIEFLPEAGQFARVTVESEDFLPFDTAEDLKALSLRINNHLNGPDVAGVVFTHGTNTIEETAYFLNLTLKSDKPR
jgi:L-asparaginase/Glu-tRNA(Gln) amidotransferase subunit D